MNLRTDTARPTTHNTRLLLSAGLLTVVMSLAACGSTDSTGGGAASTTSTPAQTSGSAGQLPDPGQAVRVSFRKTGGLRPADETVTYAADGVPPSGSSRADVRAILGVASNPELRTVDLKPPPKNPCCDLQEYTVLITYADGSTATFRTVDGLQQPPVFEDLLSMLG